MRKIYLVSIVFACIGSLTLAVGTANARRRLEVSTTAFLAAGPISFEEELGEVICDVTYHVTVQRLITKTREEAVGNVTAILTANARSSMGGATTCRPLTPMALSYDSIAGTLPRIDSVKGRLLLSWLISVVTPFGTLACLWRGLVGVSSVENPIRRLTILAPRIVILQIDLSSGSIRCRRELRIGGLYNLTPEVTVRLLER